MTGGKKKVDMHATVAKKMCREVRKRQVVLTIYPSMRFT